MTEAERLCQSIEEKLAKLGADLEQLRAEVHELHERVEALSREIEEAFADPLEGYDEHMDEVYAAQQEMRGWNTPAI